MMAVHYGWQCWSEAFTREHLFFFLSALDRQLLGKDLGVLDQPGAIPTLEPGTNPDIAPFHEHPDRALRTRVGHHANSAQCSADVALG